MFPPLQGFGPAGIRVELFRPSGDRGSEARDSASSVLAAVDQATLTAIIDTTDRDWRTRQPRFYPVLPDWARQEEASASAPALALVIVTAFGVRECYLVPVDDGPAPASYSTYGFGNLFAYTRNDRFARLTGVCGALAVHDRML